MSETNGVWVDPRAVRPTAAEKAAQRVPEVIKVVWPTSVWVQALAGRLAELLEGEQ